MTDLPPPFDAAWFRFIAGFITGMALGSFATVLAWRVPRGLSIVTPRSHCPSCGKTLAARDLVPIFSWLAARGRCRYCHAEIGARYVWIELGISLACGLIAAAI